MLREMVMSRPSEGAATLEGEASGPNYGAMNGVEQLWMGPLVHQWWAEAKEGREALRFSQPAVQSRAQRALHGQRSDDTPGSRAEGGLFVNAENYGSPQASPVSEEDRGPGSWSVTRISQVLHRRLVAPVLEHVGGGDRGPGPAQSPTWHSPAQTGAQESLMSHETRQAMATWTARPTVLTTPTAPMAQRREDSSGESMNQEVIMDEVRRQVQMAMRGRDSELQALRAEEHRSEISKRLRVDFQALNLEAFLQVGIEDLRCKEVLRLDLKVSLGYQAAILGNKGGENHPLKESLEEPMDMQLRLGEILDLEAQGAGEPGEELSPLDILVQGMKQLQQVYMDKKSPESEALKGSVELPTLPDLSGDTGVEFSDWLYVAEQIVGSLSDSSTSWFASTLALAKEAYHKHQQATPLERLTISPVISPELAAAKWSRLERRVMTMLLTAMPKAVKEDAVTHRVGTVAGAMFRLHVLYAPGGVAERTAILKQLEGQPDASVLLRGIEMIIGGALKRLPDTSFRLALARNELQLQNRPTQDTVLRYFDHALAELQQSAPSRALRAPGGGDDPPKLRAADAQAGTGGTATRTPPGSPSKSGQRQGCKFFLSDQGCRRGAGCKYAHEFATKDEKRSRCWFCGSKQHRQSECPVKDPTKAKGAGSGPTASSTSMSPQATTTVAAATAPEPKAMMAPYGNAASSTMSTTCSEGPVVQAEPVQAFTPEVMQSPELQNFVKEVNTMLQRMSALRAMRVREPIAPEMAKMEKSLEAFELPEEPWALLDSGATHPFKNVTPRDEDQTLPVQVTLADGNKVVLQQNRAGTLMPAKGSSMASGVATTTIVPLGTLVRELGCTVSWDRQGLKVKHPEHGVITTHVAGSCPFIGETKALQLIEEIEARKLEQLKVKTVESQLKMRGIEATVSFEAQLHEYRRTGKRADGLQALLCEDSVFGVMTEAQRCSLIQDVDLSDKAGHKYLKALPVKRAMRRRLMTSRWMVHFYSGEATGDGSGFKVLEEEGVTLLEIDIGISRSYNMREPGPVYQALLWAAMRGQVHGVFGGPPRAEGTGNLVMKQMFIWTLARLAAESYEIASPGFAMCMPTKSELWSSKLWSSFRREYGVNLKGGEPGISVATTLEMELPEGPWERLLPNGALTWTTDFKEALIKGFQRWRSVVHLRRMNGPLKEMTKEELARWIQHVRDGHLPFHRRCKTCVAAKATGHAHRRIEAPSCFTMSLDVCGPFRVLGHTPEAKDFKYMLAKFYQMVQSRKFQAKFYQMVQSRKFHAKFYQMVQSPKFQAKFYQMVQSPKFQAKFYQMVQSRKFHAKFYQMVQSPKFQAKFYQMVQSPKFQAKFYQMVQSPKFQAKFYQMVRHLI
ncbi:unnamed protein product [Symbiodinium sp. CCMP2592]|nr:unnamed protein product [Symbiodinium sp. CCMP2592]